MSELSTVSSTDAGSLSTLSLGDRKPESTTTSATVTDEVPDTPQEGAPEGEYEQVDINDVVHFGSKKRKKRKKAKTKLNKNCGTGFEEFYADPPMRPDEAEEEKALIYDPDRPFVARIEACLHRYRSRRRLQGNLTRYFDEYLFLGGIASSQRSFQGIDPEQYAGATKDEKAQMEAVNYISNNTHPNYYNPNDPEHWSVDFSTIVAGYISDAVPRIAWNRDPAEQETKSAIEVVANFLRYLLQHDVCNEYADDIKNALALCKRGKEDMLLCLQGIQSFPAAFGKATRELFDGEDAVLLNKPGKFKPGAESAFISAVTLYADQEVFENLKATQEIRVVKREPCDLKILSITRASEEQRETNEKLNKGDEATTHALMGVITCMRCLVEEGYDYGDAERRVSSEAAETILVDDKFLEFLKPGFILRVVLAELNIGLKFLDKMFMILPDFYTFLPQSLMLGYKPSTPNEREGPSVFDDAQDRAEAEAPGGRD